MNWIKIVPVIPGPYPHNVAPFGLTILSVVGVGLGFVLSSNEGKKNFAI